ncbi:zonadhesin-like isoform X2 [Ostrea edulis]|uniref:zonadhesin-like isoform X2 n=1 Tax=Ostrea edulis TaxID=37623 RepID=UPI0024AF0B89|nr:zonadhesin-like isoform X2 [Ostrea edulis]
MWKILLLIIFALQLEGNDGFLFWRRHRRRTRHGRINTRDMLGCYRDAAHRVLEGGRTWSNHMTVGRCKSRCLRERTRFYGVEAGNECFCGNTMRYKDRKHNNDCRMKCKGNNEACGGAWRIMIYKNPKFHTSNFVRRKGLVGCHVDGWYRTLGGAFRRSRYMTINKCLNICKRKRNIYAGVEYGRECFCGNSIRRKKKVALSQCKMPCSGYKKEGCGGTWRIAIYRTGVRNGNKCGRHRKCHSNGRCVNGECRCKKGYTGDGVKRCYKTCSCTASGDPHYYMFDGQTIHFMGICKYTLTKVKNSRKNIFNVQVKNEYHGRNRRVSYTRLVDLKLGKTTIRLHKYHKVFLNGGRIYLPYTRRGKFRIFRSGRNVKVIVNTKYGDATVTWDGRSSVVVTVPKNLGRRMTGLCGNCNGKRDDFRTKYGKDVSNLRNKFTLIGNSYAVKDDTDQIHKTCKAIETTNKCTPALRKKALDINACGFINPGKKNGSPFRDCIVGSPGASKTMFENCVFDFCTYYDDKSQRKRTICQSVGGYAEYCAARLGITVKWRSEKFCPLPCGENMVYDSEMSGCPASCVDPDSEKDCDQPSTEGCRCKDGFVLSDNKCVSKSKCGCKGADSKYYPLGARFTSSDCTTVQECKNIGGTPSFKTIQTKPKCGNHQTCVVSNGSPTCMCSKGYMSNGRSGCIEESPTCKGKKVDVQCVSPKGKKFVCAVSKAKTVVHVRSTSKFCKYGTTYGLSADGIWVSLGCKGTFSVCYIPVPPVPGPSECLAHNDPEGKDYKGSLSLTEQGYTCQKWSTQSPHSHKYLKTTNNNYCRNPDNEKAAWCYTTDPKKRWDYCHIPVCQCLDAGDEKGLKYAGHVHKTKSGKECQDWGRQRPHSHSYRKLANQGNFCRNPDNEPTPWCYTNSSATRWEACSIPDCGECEIKLERSLKCETVHKISGKCFFDSSALSKCKFSVSLNKYRNGQSEARVIMGNTAYTLQRGKTLHKCASFEMRSDILYVVEKLCDEKCTKPPIILN